MQHRLVIIGSKSENILLAREAKRRGYYTIVCDGFEDGPAKEYADKSYTIDVRDTDAIADMCKREEADGIIGSFSDLVFEEITMIAHKAGLKWYCTPERLPYYRYKNKQKELLSSLGIRVPKSKVLEEGFCEDDLKDFTFPLVIKPVNGWGSKGIFVVASMEELLSRYNDVRRYSYSPGILVEEYAKGHEHNVMAWIIDGVVIPIGVADRERTQVEAGRIPFLSRIVYPAHDYEKIYDECREVLQKFADANGQKSGVLSMQFFYNENGVEVCEIAGRFLAYEHELLTIFGGIGIIDLLLDYVYEEENIPKTFSDYHPYETFKQHSTDLYFLAKDGERIKDLSAVEELMKDPHVAETQVFYQEGEVIDNNQRFNLVKYTITAGTREELDRVTEEFYGKMYVEGENGENIAYRYELEAYDD